MRGRLQDDLFPYLEETLGPLGDTYRLLVTVFELAPVAAFLRACPGMRGRPPADRVALARAFIAKAVHGIATTALLIDRLKYDKTLRLLCGWPWAGSVPSAATFSRAFAEFAASELASRMHEALIVATHEGRLVGRVSRDATAIEAREKPVKVKAAKRCRRKRRPQKAEPGWETVRRLERQPAMTLPEMLADLPKHCAVGVKPDAKGYKNAWIGYKLHLDIADGGIPVTALLTSASPGSSPGQAAIPLAMLTARRVVNLYDLMDPSYHAPEIDAACRALGRIPIVPPQARRDKALEEEMAAEARARRAINFQTPEQVRYRERTTAERANARLKDEFGGRRVRGHAKVMSHLMFGILALTVDQLMRLLGG